MGRKYPSDKAEKRATKHATERDALFDQLTRELGWDRLADDLGWTTDSDGSVPDPRAETDTDE